jgi:hypothetical protein
MEFPIPETMQGNINQCGVKERKKQKIKTSNMELVVNIVVI